MSSSRAQADLRPGVSVGGQEQEINPAMVASTTSWSPYLGLSLDYLFMNVGGRDHGGVGAVVHGGVEFFRLHSARLLVGLDLLIPFFRLHDSDTGSYTYNLALTGNLTVMW